MRNIAKIMLGAASAIALSAGAATAQENGWCSDQTIRVFSGGPAGGRGTRFASNAEKGLVGRGELGWFRCTQGT